MQGYDWRDRIGEHDFFVDGPLTHPFEGIHIGNGDIGGSVNIYPHEIKITLAKSDIWDARFDGKADEHVLTQDDLIKLMAEKDRDLFCAWDGKDTVDYEVDYLASNKAHSGGPCLKRAGCVRLYHPGLSNTQVQTKVRLIDGVVECRFLFKMGALVVRAFIEKEGSRFYMEVESEGETPWFAFIVEKEPDEADITMPLPGQFVDSECIANLSQLIPGAHDIGDFSWYLTSAFPQIGEGVDVGAVEHFAWRHRQYCSLEPGKTARLCVGITTTRDGEGDAQARGLAMVKDAEPFADVFARHQRAWEAYWDRSNIALADQELESVWYRNHFGYACALSRVVVPLGSGGNVVVSDFVPWHGDCHMNHNFQKWFCTAFPTNHTEWIDVYADFIEEKMPMFEMQAQLIFGLPGVFCDISYLPIMSGKHANVNNLMGRALAVTGWLGQPLWWHWEFLRDKDWLEKRAYPYIKKAAEFYWHYMAKYSDETGEIYPSIKLEEPGWTKDFAGNRNVISDLCMFKKAFDRAVEASEILGVDAEWREKWKAARARVPGIDHDIDEDGQGWIGLYKNWRNVEPRHRADEARYSRWGGGGWIVYPGEYVDGDGDDSLTLALRTMIGRTDLMNAFTSQVTGENVYPGVPVIHPISSIVPAIRLGIFGHFESIRQVLLAHRLTYGQTSSYMLSQGDMPKELMGRSGFLWYDWRSVENKYIGVLAVTEMLLQSQGGVIRIFPFYPQGDIAFQNFRAVGDFVVSAERKDGKLRAKLVSGSGLEARVKWTGGSPEALCGGAAVSYKLREGILIFDTQPGCAYELIEA